MPSGQGTEIRLSPNAYTLVIASPYSWAIVPMIITAFAQLAVLWAMGYRSHSYFFSEGRWLTPFTGNIPLGFLYAEAEIC